MFYCAMPNTHRRRRRDETVLSRRRRQSEHNSQLAHDDCRRIRPTIWNWPNRLHSCLTTCILIVIDNFFNNDDIMTSLLKEVINIDLPYPERWKAELTYRLRWLSANGTVESGDFSVTSQTPTIHRVNDVYSGIFSYYIAPPSPVPTASDQTPCAHCPPYIKTLATQVTPLPIADGECQI